MLSFSDEDNNIFDERETWKVIHELQDILVLSSYAILCGTEDYEAIEECSASP